MKQYLLFGLLTFWCNLTFAQKSEYKEGRILLDGKPIAKIEKTKDKENLGLTNTYEVFSNSGEKLIIVAYVSEFEKEPNNNLNFYYRFTFLPTDQVGIFTVSKLGAEKAIGNLLASSGIIVNDKLDAGKVLEFIAKYGQIPKVEVDYTVVSRGRNWPVEFGADKSISQNGKVIGSFKDVTVPGSGIDSYEFRLPTGVLIAQVSFKDGDNAQDCIMYTLKDTSKRAVAILSKEKVSISASVTDRNLIALKRITNWLIANSYL